MPPVIPSGFEQDAIETARAVLADVPACAGAEYRVKWLPSKLPILVIEFAQFARRGWSPACAVALCTVRRGTLSESLPGKTLLSGQRLRDAILRSVHDYLHAATPEETMKRAHL